MKSFVRHLRRAVVSGSYASLASTLALLHGGVRDTGSAIAPVNAVSHWLWKDKSFRRHEPSLRYSLTGYLIHHLASIFWATAYERLAFRQGRAPSKAAALASAATIAGVACVVDMQCTPERLTPGFERKLSKKSLLGVYAAFGVGLALHTLLRRKGD